MLKLLKRILRVRYSKHPKFALLGKGVEVDESVYFNFPERIKLGNYVHIEPRGFFDGKGGLEIEDHVIIAPEVVILTTKHRYKGASMVPYDQVDLLSPVKIERCVWVGMRAMILPGVTIGEGSIIGAGAVVTKSCSPGSILGGNPAQTIGQRDMTLYNKLVREDKFYLYLKQKENLQKEELLEKE